MEHTSEYLRQTEREKKSFMAMLSTGYNAFQLGWNILNAPANYARMRRAQEHQDRMSRMGVAQAFQRLALLNQSSEIQTRQIAQEHMAAQSLFETTAAGSLGSLSELSRQSIIDTLQTSKDLYQRALIQRQAVEESSINLEIEQMRYREREANMSWAEYLYRGIFYPIAEGVDAVRTWLSL